MIQPKIFDKQTVDELGGMGLELKAYFQKKYNTINWTNEDTEILADRLMQAFELGFMACADKVEKLEGMIS